MTPLLPTLTIVIPVFNEQECIAALFQRLEALREAMRKEVDVSLLFVDDGSTDASFSLLEQIAQRTPYVQVVCLSRNFGHQMAVTAGIDFAGGDWVAILDADLQDPPETLVEMLRLAQSGYDVVYGQRRRRAGETTFKRASAAAFYRILARMSDVSIPEDTGDFRVMSRRVVTALATMRERHRFLRGMIPWVGFRSAPYVYDRDERFAGQTKYPLAKMIRFAANAIFSFSSRPLALATRLGAIVSCMGAAGAIYMIYLKLFTNIPVPGVTSVLVAMALFGGVQILLIGLVGEYVARVFEEAKNRPLYVVAEVRNVVSADCRDVDARA